MRSLFYIAYLLALSLTLQVSHIHFDAAEDDAAQCVMCIKHVDDDVIHSQTVATTLALQSFLTIDHDVVVTLAANSPQRARSPPYTL